MTTALHGTTVQEIEKQQRSCLLQSVEDAINVIGLAKCGCHGLELHFGRILCLGIFKLVFSEIVSHQRVCIAVGR